MRKSVPLLMCLLLTALAGCRAEIAEGEYVSIPAAEYTSAAEAMYTERTESPAPEATAEAEITAEPSEQVIPMDVDEAVAMYEGYPLGFTPLERSDAPADEELSELRYKRGDDGIYRSETASNDGEAVIMLTGDIMCQTRQQLAALKPDGSFDFNGSFDFVKSLFSKADLVVGNLEATLSASAPYMSEQDYVDFSPHLNAPSSFLKAVRDAGYDLLTMSNNHNCDAGVRGIYDTIDRVDDYGFMHTGLFKNAAEKRYIIVDIEGINIGFLAYSTYFNHKEEHLSNEGRSALLNIYSAEKLSRDIASARADGADYIMVCIHWGMEYRNETDLNERISVTERLSGRSFNLLATLDNQTAAAREIADCGADYIIGSHPHALQPYDEITASDGRQVPIIYSMGNFLSHQKRDISNDTLILRIILKKNADGSIGVVKQGYVPARTLVSFMGRNYTVVPITYPYNQGLSSNEFAPAYRRIVDVIGEGIEVMGSR